MLKIIIDATPMFPKPTGVGFYVANLISSLQALQAQENFQLSIAYQPGLKNWLLGKIAIPECLYQYSSHLHLIPLPVRISKFILSSSYKSKFLLNSVENYFENCFDSPNIVHGTNYSVYPCRHSFKAMTIYDLSFIKYPEYIDAVVKTYTEQVKQCLKWTDLILTISESSKRDIIEYLHVDPSKVYVTPLASRYHPDYLSPAMINQLESEANYDFSQPYILFVSTIEPRKNIIALIEAFNLLKQQQKIPHNLVLIGKKGWHYEPIFAAIKNSSWQSCIYHLDYLTDELVALFYAKADVFVYPSHYEGFGLPVLEAMTLGAPVVTANTSSLPEIVGDAALMIDPNNYIELAESIWKIISNSQLRIELINTGKQQAKLFTWERTAQATFTAYKSIIA